jgi:sulfur relay (sulfurtransferase) complex TusBCD TusD component (DsrE family)
MQPRRFFLSRLANLLSSRWRRLTVYRRKVVAKPIPIYACGACSRARGVTEADLSNYGAKYGNPTIFVSLVEWADRVITE